ncbi:penicillin-binding protein 2 [Paenibacillus antri]|uniref:Penicillin-binding protein 2 n=1 Tax=Paenibacillus antri TaxID=2582848 RepID=A0A5R9GA88_9BACL|nr:penicillin-binding protein 2 [Paenibacillus antri]TLS53357.1 penicillin-binding protein 2 [Paenibacillus antri]
MNRFTTLDDDPQKNEIAKRRHFTFRINVFFFAVFLLFSVLIVRLAFIQFVEGKTLSAQESERTTRTVLIPPIRGNIYDRNGYPIAYSTSTQSVYYRMEPGKKLEDHQALALALTDLFRRYGDYPDGPPKVEDVFEAMDVGYDWSGERKTMFNTMFEPRRVKSGLTKEEIAYLMAHPEQFPGIEVTEESVRHYDSNTIASQLIGYLKPFSSSNNQKAQYLDYYKDPENTKDYLRMEQVGFDGLEFLYQETLRGKSGARNYPVNSLDQIVGPVTTIPPTKGNFLYLTLDKDVQLIAEQSILDQLEHMQKSTEKYPSMGKNALAGYAVAMEVDTGNVVAMASMPDYDSNVWSGSTMPLSVYQAIEPFYQNGTIKTVYPDVPEGKNRARYPSSIVPLGSTLKPLTVLIGLNEGFYSSTDRYTDTGRFYYGRNDSASIGNSEGHSYGKITPSEAIRVSSNTFMAAMVGEKLYEKYGGENGGPIDVWDDYMKKFGLGVPTGSGLPMETAGVLDYNSKDTRGSVQNAMVMASFGQQGRYTTLQLAQYTAMLANRGKRMKPNFVDKITDFEGQIVETIEPVVLNEETFDSKHWDVVHNGMKSVTKSNSLSQWFGRLPFEVSSKTGTSQQDTAAGKIENSVFIAFAPADDPKLAVAVVVPWGGYGAWGAAPIAAKIFEAYHEYVGFDGKPAGPMSTPPADAETPPADDSTERDVTPPTE